MGFAGTGAAESFMEDLADGVATLRWDKGLAAGSGFFLEDSGDVERGFQRAPIGSLKICKVMLPRCVGSLINPNPLVAIVSTSPVSVGAMERISRESGKLCAAGRASRFQTSLPIAITSRVVPVRLTSGMVLSASNERRRVSVLSETLSS